MGITNVPTWSVYFMNEMNSAIFTIIGALVIVFGILWVTAWICRGKNLIYSGIGVMALVCCGGYFVIPRPPVYEYTLEKDGCCKVVQLADLYTWKLHKADGDFTARFCHDYDLRAYDPAPGLMLRKLRYEDLGECWSVKRQDLGFWWLRDDHMKVVAEKIN